MWRGIQLPLGKHILRNIRTLRVETSPLNRLRVSVRSTCKLFTGTVTEISQAAVLSGSHVALPTQPA